MFSLGNKFRGRCLWLMQQKLTLTGFVLLVCLTAFILLIHAALPAQAQGSFSSGSTGADGAFNPTTSQTIQLPPSGVFNYTTVNIPSGVTIKYTRNANNTPVTILATGAVTIVGTIDVSGQVGASNGPFAGGGAGGPGGFDGGRGGYPAASVVNGVAGDGPGGGEGGGKVTSSGCASGGGGGGFFDVGSNGISFIGCGPSLPGNGGPRYGSNTLLPLIGGSGGGGGAATTGPGGAGGGGGGAILIASSGTITFNNGSVIAVGGNGGSGSNAPGGAGGAGGAIRLIANTISGTGSLNVSRGSQGGSSGSGSSGYVRIEAFTFTNFVPNISPSGQQSFSSFGLPSSVTLPSTPTLKIASVAGIAAPATPNGSFSKPADIVVPTAQANPVTVALQAANIPLGTIVQVTLTPETGAFTTMQSTALAGTVAASTASASITLPASGISVINATTSYDVPSSGNRTSQMLIDGESIKRVEIATSYGGKSEVTYITESGKRIKRTSE